MRPDPFRTPAARARFIEAYDAVLAGWTAPYDEDDVDTTFGTTHTVVSGSEDAPPVVLLHGAACTAAMWGPVVPVLSRTHRCYCVDTISEGNKSVLEKRMSRTADCVQWLRELFSALNIDRAHVVRLSYGGWLAANLAVRAPELVERLVLLCPAATLTRLRTEFYLRVMAANITRSRALADSTCRWLSGRDEHTPDAALELVATNILTNRTLRLEGRPPSRLTDAELRSIEAPTTVMIGSREVIYTAPPAVALERARSVIPDVRTHLVEGAGHVLTVDAPTTVATHVVDALV